MSRLLLLSWSLRPELDLSSLGHSASVLRASVALLRPSYAPSDTAGRTVPRPGTLRSVNAVPGEGGAHRGRETLIASRV